MSKLIYVFMFFSQILICSSSTTNTKKTTQTKATIDSRRFNALNAVSTSVIQNTSNSEKTSNKKSAQNDDDYDDNEKTALSFQQKEHLKDLLDNFEENLINFLDVFDEIDEPINLLKKDRHSKLSFPNKRVLDEKISSKNLKEANLTDKSQAKLDLKNFSVLTVHTQLLTESGTISHQNDSDSDSEDASAFNSYRSDKNNSSQPAKK